MEKEKFDNIFHNILKNGRINIMEEGNEIRHSKLKIKSSVIPEDWRPADVVKEVEKESIYIR